MKKVLESLMLPKEEPKKARETIKRTIEWISVDDALPAMGVDVLIYSKGYSSLGVERTYNYNNAADWCEGWRKGEQYEVLYWAYIEKPTDKIRKRK